MWRIVQRALVVMPFILGGAAGQALDGVLAWLVAVALIIVGFAALDRFHGLFGTDEMEATG